MLSALMALKERAQQTDERSVMTVSMMSGDHRLEKSAG
jgi:hypothetical protein